jgi:hypothetical protein
MLYLASPAWSKARYFDLTVRDPKGAPVSGALIEGGAYPWPQTDLAGRIAVESDATKLIVRKSGYKSTVLAVEKATKAIISVVLQPSLRRASACPAATEFKGGKSEKLSFPDMSQLLYLPGVQDPDFPAWKYSLVGDGPLGWFRRLFAEVFDVPTIIHAMGPRWSDGFPLFGEAEEAEDYSEELIPLAAQSSYTDARGTRSDGTLWRFIGTQSETLSYEVESRGEAAALNHIFDTVCVRPDLLP